VGSAAVVVASGAQAKIMALFTFTYLHLPCFGLISSGRPHHAAPLNAGIETRMHSRRENPAANGSLIW
jgi:hypothetical protein